MDINLLLIGISLAVLPFLFFQLYKINRRRDKIFDRTDALINQAQADLRAKVKASREVKEKSK